MLFFVATPKAKLEQKLRNHIKKQEIKKLQLASVYSIVELDLVDFREVANNKIAILNYCIETLDSLHTHAELVAHIETEKVKKNN